MKKNNSAIIVGAVLILIGVFVVGRVFDLITFSLFFDGWWTLFIIIPCIVGIINNHGTRSASVIGLIIGVMLLLCAQDIVEWKMFAPLCLAAAFVFIGLKMIIGNVTGKDTIENAKYREFTSTTNQTGGTTGNQTTYTYQADANSYTNANTANGTAQNSYTNANQYNSAQSASNANTSNANTGNANANNTTGNGNNANFNQGSTYRNADMNRETCVCTAVLSGRNIRFDNETFRGAMLSAFLGGIELDLRNALINNTVTIEAKALMGGIEIWVPNYVRVVVNGTPILGGIDNTTRTPAGANESTPTVIVNASCILGGVEIK